MSNGKPTHFMITDDNKHLFKKKRKSRADFIVEQKEKFKEDRAERMEKRRLLHAERRKDFKGGGRQCHY